MSDPCHEDHYPARDGVLGTNIGQIIGGTDPRDAMLENGGVNSGVSGELIVFVLAVPARILQSEGGEQSYSFYYASC